jgi:hypothetical protein
VLQGFIGGDPAARVNNKELLYQIIEVKAFGRKTAP